MHQFIGTKIINAKPMTRQEYNDFRGWELPGDEDGNDEGFLVEYVDGGQPNTKEYDGYVSWSPKYVFERSYKNVNTGMAFGDAIFMLKQGKKVARKGWNGRGMWLVFVPGTKSAEIRPGTTYHKALSSEIPGINGSTSIVSEILPHIDMWTVNAEGRRAMLPGWVASQTNMLAEDWVIVD